MKLEFKLCKDISWMGFYGQVKKCVVRRCMREANEIHGSGTKRWKMQQDRMMHTRLCVEIVLRSWEKNKSKEISFEWNEKIVDF